MSTGKVVFFGSGPVAAPVLTKLYSSYGALEVVSHQTQHSNSSSQVQQYCKQNSIPLHMPVSNKTSKEQRKSDWESFLPTLADCHLGVVCSFGFMIPSKIISAFKRGLIVVHPSLLPIYRGGAPIFHAIANGDTESGVSYIEVSKGQFDAGPLLFQAKCSLSLEASYKQIQTQLANLGAQHITHVLNNLDQLRPGVQQSQLKCIPGRQKAPIIKERTVNLQMSCIQIYNKARAIQNAHFTLNNQEIIICFGRQILPLMNNQQPLGLIKKHGKQLHLRCGDGYLRIVAWKEPTRPQLPIRSLIDKHLSKLPQTDWIVSPSKA